MKRNKRNIRLIKAVNVLIIAFLISCINADNEYIATIGISYIGFSSNDFSHRTIQKTLFEDIIERGKIVATTNCNSIDYFIYKGQPMGFQYELLQQFANYLGIDAEYIINNDLNINFDCLLEKNCDLIALDITITKDRTKKVDFAVPHIQTRQVLVQRKPDNWQRMSKKEIEKHLIRNQLDIAGKTITIQKGTSYHTRLLNFQEEIGDSIYIVIDEEKEVEQLIAMVAEGKIEYTVCDEHVALVNQTYYDNIDIKTDISYPQNLAWAVRKGSDSLLVYINKWMTEFKKTRKFKYIYRKYFKNSRTKNIVASEFYSQRGGKISRYDKILKEKCVEIGWDWRLLASLIYQESRFKSQVESWAGAFGLMQLMPETALRFGVDKSSPPSRQIEAGIKFIKWIDRQLPDEITNTQERLKFTLASYNAGVGHVFDARRLAKKYNKDPNIWTGNVDFFMLNKANSKYYRDEVVQFGYCRGSESYRFVIEILERYEHYKNVISK